MDWQTFAGNAADVLELQLFTIAGTPVTVGTLLTSLAIVVATFWVSRLVQRATEAFLTGRGVRDEGTIGAAKRLLHYTVLMVGFGVAIHTMGVNLSTLFAAGAIFAVGIGFAMQNITSNFVSGIILLGERAIKPGDILQVGGHMVRVRDMGIRATIVRTLDDEDVIIPNSDLVQSSVKNYTFRDDLFRIRVGVGVSYGSDMRSVRTVLENCARAVDWRAQGHDPVVLLADFGSSSVDFEVSVWIEDPWKSRWGRSHLREAIWWALADAGITIAFPQLDVHVDEPVIQALGRSAAA